MVRPAQHLDGDDAQLRGAAGCAGGRRAVLRPLPARDGHRPPGSSRRHRESAHALARGGGGAHRPAAAGRGRAVPEAHDPSPAAGDGPRVDGRGHPRLPDPRPGPRGGVVREGARRADPGRPGLRPAGGDLQGPRRPGGGRGGRAARPTGHAGDVVRGSRDRVRPGDAELAAGPARHRRRVGRTLVRGGGGVDRLRPVRPDRARGAGATGMVGRGGEAVLRGTGSAQAIGPPRRGPRRGRGTASPPATSPGPPCPRRSGGRRSR